MSDNLSEFDSLVGKLNDAEIAPALDPPNERLIEELFALLIEARRDLRSRLVFNWDILELQSKSDQRLRIWYTYHGVLAWDLLGGMEVLLRSSMPRVAVILLRSLLEYNVRIRFGAKRRSEVKKAFQQLTARYRRLLAAEPRSWVDLQTKQQRTSRQELLASGAQQVSSEKVKVAFEEALGKRTGNAMYYRTYGMWSMMVHGHEACIPDVFRNRFTGQEPANQIDWNSRRWSIYDILATAISLACEIIASIETLSGRGNAATVIYEKLIAAQVKYDPEHREFMRKLEAQWKKRSKRRASYIKKRG